MFIKCTYAFKGFKAWQLFLNEVYYANNIRIDMKVGRNNISVDITYIYIY